MNTQTFDMLIGPSRTKSVLGVAIASVTVIVLFKRAIGIRRGSTSEFKNIPMPKGKYFYLGHIPFIARNSGKAMLKWHDECGPVYRIKMGVQNWLFIGDPQMAHDIFVTKGSFTSNRPHCTFLSLLNGNRQSAVLFAENEHWKYARATLNTILSPRSINSLSHTLENEIGRSIDLMIKDAQTLGEIDPMIYIRLTTMNVFLVLAFSISGARSVDDPLYSKMNRVVEKSVSFLDPALDISNMLPLWKFFDFFSSKEHQMTEYLENELKPFIRSIIERARASEKDNLMKKLDEAKDQDKLDETHIEALIAETLFAAIDTVSVTTTWAVAYLCNHPKVQEKMYQEIDTFVKKHGRIPSFTDRAELPYCFSFQKECLRFRPPGFTGIPHKVSKDIVYKDCVIPKDTLIIANMLKNADQFIPERYIEDTRSISACNSMHTTKRTDITFGFGRRTCPGSYMAEREIFSMLVELVSKCTIKPILSSKGIPVYPKLDEYIDESVIAPPAQFKFRLVKREKETVN
ncbi:cytochrome P450 [Rhizopus microsporus var. microsporus]|uniref:Cytochrome P450 n=1 Tax=Rhizopus microsporus var. microsporus TaxID=86635 RepID=A0A1X0REI4_RHIZD|nr:cytochrome P450 [Rhizopus microsporus var. microsporus]